MDIEQIAFFARGHRPLRPCACDVHVLVFRNEKGDRQSTGVPRCMIPMALRFGLEAGAAVAAAQQCAAHHDFVLRGRQSARLWAFAARPLVSIIIRTACFTTGGRASGSSPTVPGARAPCSSSKSRPTMKSTTISSPCGCRRRPRAAGSEVTLSYRLYLGGRRALTRPISRAASRPVWAMAASPASQGPRACGSSWSSSRDAPLEALPFGVKPEAVLWASRGTFSYVFTEAVPDDVPGHWRAQFDLTVAGSRSGRDAPLSCARAKKSLSETWLYQYHPF